MDLNLDLDSVSFFEQADKSKVPPILQKRILAFVNHFILKTCTFLNDFVEECEIKFIETERKMQKLEATLVILEEKLASIPDLEKNIKSVDENDKLDEKHIESNEVSESNETVDVGGVKTNEDARYRKFFKMLQFGVPPLAIKNKMKVEGLNPDLLDTPNAVLEDGIPYQPEQGDS